MESGRVNSTSALKNQRRMHVILTQRPASLQILSKAGGRLFVAAAVAISGGPSAAGAAVQPPLPGAFDLHELRHRPVEKDPPAVERDERTSLRRTAYLRLVKPE